MIFKADQQDFRPEILVERVLRLDDRKIIAGRDDASIEHDEIVFTGGEDDLLLTPGAHKEQKDGAPDRSDFTEEII